MSNPMNDYTLIATSENVKSAKSSDDFADFKFSEMLFRALKTKPKQIICRAFASSLLSSVHTHLLKIICILTSVAAAKMRKDKHLRKSLYDRKYF